MGAVVASCAVGLAPLAAGASATETAVTIPGNPLTVNIGPLGQCQSSYLVNGAVAGNYYLGSEPIGDCGFFLAFTPKAQAAEQPTELDSKTFGFNGHAGPSGLQLYEAVSQSAITGSGTEASPYTQVTKFNVVTLEGETKKTWAEVTETTTYVTGQPQFTSTFSVKNVSSGKIFFRAMYAGDLYVNGNDLGTGVFLAGPPRFIGGQNTGSGVIGGFVEAPAPALPWSAFQEAYWDNGEGYAGAAPTDNGIWHDVESTVALPHAFNESVEPLELDNGAGVEWDQYRTVGVAKEETASFTIMNRTQIPGGLQISPTTLTVTQGQTAAINVTSLDTANQPYAGKALRYTISGANPQSNAITLNNEGKATLSYVAHNPGIDTVQMYVDLGGTGSQTASDPSGTATVTVVPAPPVPNSTYTVRSIHANPDGTITIVFVPAQNGAASVEVTVPTGTIAKKHKAKKCKKGQAKIKGKCRAKTSVVGTAHANGTAGVPLTITVHLSHKAKHALKKGKALHLLAKLTYTSALGGSPTVNTYHVTVKGKKHHKKPKHGKHKK